METILSEQSQFPGMSRKRLDTSVKAFDIAAAYLVQGLHTRKAFALQALNSYLPFNRLPAQVRSKIFLAAIGEDHRSLERVRTLALVCHRWMAEIVSTPDAWAVIGTAGQRRLVSRALQSSDGLPLRIYVDATDFSKLSDQWNQFIDLIQTHSQRWTVLSLAGLDKVKTQAFLSCPSLRLRSLAVHPSQQVTNLTLNLPSDSGHSPRFLALHYSSFPWKSTHLSDLISLRLVGIKGTRAIPSQLLCRCLRDSPRLESVWFEDLDLTQATEPPPMMHVPNLTEVVITSVPIWFIDLLASCITGTTLRSLRLRLQAVDEKQAQALSSLLTIGNPLHSYMQTVLVTPTSRRAHFIITQRPDIKEDSSFYGFAFPGLYLHLGGIFVDKALNLLGSLFPVEGMSVGSTLTVYGDVRPGNVAFPIISILRGLKSLDELNLHSPKSAIAITSALSRQQILQGGGTEKAWLCPELTRLGLSPAVAGFKQIVLDMIALRYPAVSDEDEEDGIARPMVLEVMTILGSSEKGQFAGLGSSVASQMRRALETSAPSGTKKKGRGTTEDVAFTFAQPATTQHD